MQLSSFKYVDNIGFNPLVKREKAQLLKRDVNRVQDQFLNQFYDYKEGYQELARFDQTAYYQHRVLNQLNQYEQAQAKEQRFLSLYEYSLNLVSMIALFATLYLGVIQVQNQQLDVVYLTSIVLMMLTLFEQAIPMSNVAYYKAETDEALSNINEVIAHPMQQGNQPLSLESDVHQPFVEVKNVDFKYWNQSNYTLKELKLRCMKVNM